MQPSRIEPERALAILQQLIRIRTIQPHGDEMDGIKYILSLFPEACVETRVIDHGNNRASMVLTVPGVRRDKAVALVGHMDTQGLAGTESWTHALFAADCEDGVVYGRGAANMKGGLTAAILALREVVEGEIPPPQDTILCLTADGDMKGFGAHAITQGGFLDSVKAVIFAEPTDCRICIVQKGVLWVRVTVRGKRAHACLPDQGINAVEGLFRMHRELQKYLKRSIPHRLLGAATATLTQIRGGGEINHVPESAEGSLDIRTLPSLSNEEILEELHRIAERLRRIGDAADVTLTVENDRPAVGMDEEAPLIRTLRDITTSLGMESTTRGLLYFTDANRMVPALGVPFAILGPGRDTYASQSDEHVAIDSVLTAARIYHRFIYADYPDTP